MDLVDPVHTHIMRLGTLIPMELSERHELRSRQGYGFLRPGTVGTHEGMNPNDPYRFIPCPLGMIVPKNTG